MIVLQSIVVFYLTDDLNLVLNLQIRRGKNRFVAALPDGGAFYIYHVSGYKTYQVWRVTAAGHKYVHRCIRCHLRGLLVLNNNLYVIYYNGTLAEINIDNTTIVHFYQIPDVKWMVHYGSLSYHPSVITHPDLLLLADWDKGEIFSYNVTSETKEVHLTGLWRPTSVSFMTYNSHLYYIVCEYFRDQVHVFDSSWSLYQTLGGPRSGERQLEGPFSAIGLPDGPVIISDELNNRVSLFTIEGKFGRHVLTRSDGLLYPQAMSISLPYIWLVDYRGDDYRLLRYKFV